MKNKKINEQQILDYNLSLWNKKQNTTMEEQPYYYYCFTYGLATIYIRKNRKKYQICGKIPNNIITNWKKYKTDMIEKRKLFDIYFEDKNIDFVRKKYLEITKEIIKYFETDTELQFTLKEFNGF